MPGLEKRIFAHYAVPFNTVRREYGLPELPDIRECMCSESFNLVADIEEFFPHVPDMPQERYQYVGPLIVGEQCARAALACDVGPESTDRVSDHGQHGPARADQGDPEASRGRRVPGDLHHGDGDRRRTAAGLLRGPLCAGEDLVRARPTSSSAMRETAPSTRRCRAANRSSACRNSTTRSSTCSASRRLESA